MISGDYNIPVKNNTIVIPQETGVEIGERLVEVDKNKDSSYIYNEDVYDELVKNKLISKGMKPNSIIPATLELRRLKRFLLGTAVKQDQVVKEGYKIRLSHKYDGVKRVLIKPHERKLEIVPLKTY